MPTILRENGWRLFFYSNERNEPLHIHACKGETICKYWIIPEIPLILKARSANLNTTLKREIETILYRHHKTIQQKWYDFFGNP